MKKRVEAMRPLINMNLVPLIKAMDEKMEKKINAELKPFEITFSQARVIGVLYNLNMDGCSMKELEKTFRVSQQTMAGIVKRLEDKKFVFGYIDTDDKRVKRICLTEEGRKFGADATEKMKEMNRWITKSLSSEEEKTLMGLLQRVYSEME